MEQNYQQNLASLGGALIGLSGTSTHLEDLFRIIVPGVGFPHGHRPIKKAEDVPDLKTSFDPKYIAVVFLNFTAAWKIEINHASWGAAGLDVTGRLAKAVYVLKERVAGKRFKDLTGDYKPYLRTDNQQLEMTSFDKFGFATQNEIFIFINNPSVEVSRDWPITFTPFSDTGRSRDPSHSFFNAEVLPPQDGLSGRLIRVRNYMVDEKYVPLDERNPKSLTYAMNIHFRMPGETQSVPMVVDPDTGNGTGNEP